MCHGEGSFEGGNVSTHSEAFSQAESGRSFGPSTGAGEAKWREVPTYFNQTALPRQEVDHMPTAASAGSELRLQGSDPRDRTGVGRHEDILRGLVKHS